MVRNLFKTEQSLYILQEIRTADKEQVQHHISFGGASDVGQSETEPNIP